MKRPGGIKSIKRRGDNRGVKHFADGGMGDSMGGGGYSDGGGWGGGGGWGDAATPGSAGGGYMGSEVEGRGGFGGFMDSIGHALSNPVGVDTATMNAGAGAGGYSAMENAGLGGGSSGFDTGDMLTDHVVRRDAEAAAAAAQQQAATKPVQPAYRPSAASAQSIINANLSGMPQGGQGGQQQYQYNPGQAMQFRPQQQPAWMQPQQVQPRMGTNPYAMQNYQQQAPMQGRGLASLAQQPRYQPQQAGGKMGGGVPQQLQQAMQQRAPQGQQMPSQLQQIMSQYRPQQGGGKGGSPAPTPTMGQNGQPLQPHQMRAYEAMAAQNAAAMSRGMPQAQMQMQQPGAMSQSDAVRQMMAQIGMRQQQAPDVGNMIVPSGVTSADLASQAEAARARFSNMTDAQRSAMTTPDLSMRTQQGGQQMPSMSQQSNGLASLARQPQYQPQMGNGKGGR